MPYKDLHSDPFDETTITKLEIFGDYAEAWIPTFVMQPNINEIHVFDFFAGPGYDTNGVPGSPIRLLEKVNSYLGFFLSKKKKIVLHLNEFEPNKSKQEKFSLLQQNCQEFEVTNPKLKYFAKIEYYNKPAERLFFELLSSIRKFPSLVYLDQNGVKFISQEFIGELEKLNTVDFIYFVSSSYFWRLGTTEEFKKVLNFDMEELKAGKYENIHRKIISEIKKYLPLNSKLQLFPFSLKKGPNIYGIIFGAKHFRAVDKFLDIAWKRNATNGEADFDIDDDVYKSGTDLFGRRGITKIEKFQKELKEKLVNGELRDNKDVLIFTYQNGHIPSHTKPVIAALKGSSLTYEGKTAGINYDNVFKKEKIVKYKLLK